MVCKLSIGAMVPLLALAVDEQCHMLLDSPNRLRRRPQVSNQSQPSENPSKPGPFRNISAGGIEKAASLEPGDGWGGSVDQTCWWMGWGP